MFSTQRVIIPPVPTIPAILICTNPKAISTATITRSVTTPEVSMNSAIRLARRSWVTTFLLLFHLLLQSFPSLLQPSERAQQILHKNNQPPNTNLRCPTSVSFSNPTPKHPLHFSLSMYSTAFLFTPALTSLSLYSYSISSTLPSKPAWRTR